ncbi:MAG: DUF378 domain-containing protein [Candidatus Zixiibacteriota bacterium]
MKLFDVIFASLLVIGGLNWGLVGIFHFDLVAGIFGNMSMVSRIVYILVGLSALFQITQLRAIMRRWSVVNA